MAKKKRRGKQACVGCKETLPIGDGSWCRVCDVLRCDRSRCPGCDCILSEALADIEAVSYLGISATEIQDIRDGLDGLENDDSQPAMSGHPAPTPRRPCSFCGSALLPDDLNSDEDLGLVFCDGRRCYEAYGRLLGTLGHAA